MFPIIAAYFRIGLCLTVLWHVSGDDLKPFELNDFLKGTYVNKQWNGTWISGGDFIYKYDLDKNVYRYSATNNNVEVFFTATVLENYSGATFTVSSDEQFLLIEYNVESIFRHSTTAQYAIYSIAEKKYYDVHEKKHVQLVQWAPTGNALLYVFENNIYYLQTPDSVETPKQITNDGIPGVIYNGVPDWVYEEEVLGDGSALWFSPSGNSVAFAKFDDKAVKNYSYFMYGRPGDIEDQYPETITIRYPKAGETNPTVSLKVAQLSSGGKPETLLELKEDEILFDVTWANDDDVVSVNMNRIQNKLQLYRCNSNGCVNANTKLSNARGWLDNPAPVFNKDGSKYIVQISQPEGGDSFQHLVLIDAKTGNSTRLTSGKRVVTKCLAWVTATNSVYYVGSVENKPSQQQVYVVNTETLNDKCITCDFATPEGLCEYASASFSKDFSHYAKTCLGPGPAIASIHKTGSDSAVMVWEDNHIIRKQMSSLLQPVVRDLEVKVSDNFTAKVRLLLPPNLDETKKYPMIVDVYAGPDSNQISDAFSTGFKSYIVTNRNYIYAYIDGRGSGRRGDNLLFEIYRRLGTVEIEDQISVTKYLQEHLGFIDRNRTGIWGWSYGGFSTAWVMVKDVENVFRCGLSVAPVTDFIYYDSIYTERYMGLPTPDDNEHGYNNTDITRNTEAFRGKLFYLIHGNADDNVHYQQSMLLTKALEEADVLFWQHSYPDENHSLQHVYSHLYHTIDAFWAGSFGLK